MAIHHRQPTAISSMLLIALVLLMPSITWAQDPEAPPVSNDKILSTLRAQVSAGLVLANATERLNLFAGPEKTTNNQFSKANLYLSLEMSPDVFPHPTHLFVDPLINVRLTSVGVNLAPASGAETFDSAKFVESQKAAIIQLGGVAGWAFATPGKDLEWRVGFIERTIVQSITEGERTSRFWDPDDDIYTAYTHGVRLSLNSVTEGPTGHSRPVFYIDVSRGTFENYETPTGATDTGRACLSSLAKCAVLGNTQPGSLLVNAKDFAASRKYRTFIESRLYLSGFHFGFDVNNGEGIDDMRFLFGGTFDIKKLF